VSRSLLVLVLPILLFGTPATADPIKAKVEERRALDTQVKRDISRGDYKAVADDFAKYLALDPDNVKVWVEFGDTMMGGRSYDAALAAYASAEKLLARDPTRGASTRLEVIARRGQAFEGLDKLPEALAEYERAMAGVPPGFYIEMEVTARIVDIYRRRNALPMILAKLETKWPLSRRRFFEWETLGKLYEETGSSDKAITALQKAVALSPYELDAQRRLVLLFDDAGRPDDALAQLETIARVAPGEARAQLELADRLWGRANRARALEIAARMEARFGSDAATLTAVGDLYERWGKLDLAVKVRAAAKKVPPEPPMRRR
jgi:tetratricopeptide (TPR) repeat protein